MLVLGLSNLFCAPGGIPAFNRLLCRAAAGYAEDRDLPLRVLVLADDAGTVPEGGVLPAWAEYRAFSADRARFAAAVLAARRARPRLCLGHVNLAPLGVGAPRGFGVVAHGTEVWQPLPLPRRLALRRARAVACVSRHTARCVEGVQGVDAERCVRVINALPVDADHLPPPAPPRHDGGPVEVLSITRLHPGEPKGIDLMLEALVHLPGVVYTVIGEGAALPALHTLAARLGLGGRVRFLGRVSEADKDAALRRCDLFALPSSGEGFGIVYLEAMARGKPCLAAQVGGAPEVVCDEVTGLCVPPAPGPILSALRRLCGDAGLRQRLGEAGRRRVADHFCYPHFRARAGHFFDHLC